MKKALIACFLSLMSLVAFASAADQGKDGKPSATCPPGTAAAGGDKWGYPFCLPLRQSYHPETVAPAATRCVRTRTGGNMCSEDPRGACMEDARGDVACSRPWGGIARDSRGAVSCGRGDCATDAFGKTFCSSTPGGAATQDGKGGVACAGGCSEGDQALCLPAVNVER